MNKLNTLAIALLLSSGTANASHVGNGSIMDGFTLEGTLNNPLVCGVVIGDGTESTLTAGVTVGSSVGTPSKEVSFVNNNGRFNYIKLIANVTIDPNLTGEAGNIENYSLVINKQGYSYESPLNEQIQQLANNGEKYTYTIKANNLTIADFPYSDDLSINVSFDILCE